MSDSIGNVQVKHEERGHHRLSDSMKDITRRNESPEPSDARILSQIEHMADQLSKTQTLIGELEDRLESILIPDFKDSAEPMLPNHKASSPVSLLLDVNNGRVSDLQRRLVQLIGRIQL